MYEDTIFETPVVGDLVVYSHAFNVRMSQLIGVILWASTDASQILVMWMGPGVIGMNYERHRPTDVIVVKDEEHARRIRSSRCVKL